MTGLGLALLHRAGLKSESSPGAAQSCGATRAGSWELSSYVRVIRTRPQPSNNCCSKRACDENEVAFVGDDLPDIPIMNRAELAVAVADAVEETRSVAHYVTQS